jgi:hypothetical protein
MLRLFPLQEIRPRAPFADEPEDAIDSRYRLIQETCLAVPEAEDEELSKKAIDKKLTISKEAPTLQRIRNRPLEHYRKVSELSETALAFYNRAGKQPPLMGLCRDVR